MFQVVLSLSLVAIVVVWTLPSLLPATRDDVDRFAQAHDIDPGPEGRRLVRYQLTLGSRLRVLLFVDGVVVPPMLFAALGLGQINLALLVALVVAAGIVAVLVTELAMNRPAGSGRRTASLRPRDPRSYVPAPLRWAPGIGAAGTVVALVATQLVTYPPRTWETWTLGDQAPPLGWVIVACIFVAALPTASVLGSRWILARPQPFVSTDLVATDDALREASVRRIATLASVGAAISLSLAVTALGGALDDGSAPQTALSAVLLVSLLAIVAVLALAKRRTFTAARLDRTRS
jgi:hypothetical protein